MAISFRGRLISGVLPHVPGHKIATDAGQVQDRPGSFSPKEA